MKNDKELIAKELLRLVEIMEKLRSPDGCSWDRKQTHSSLAKYIKEESEEVIEAINSEDTLHIVEELGDLLMLIVFNSQIGMEQGTFTLAEVAAGISDKLVSRHPHVFGDAEKGIDPEKVLEMWGELKKKEKAHRGKISNRMKEALKFPSAIRLTEKVQNEAAGVGFDFPNHKEAFKKIQEETEEVSQLIEKEDCEPGKFEEEIGDLLFSVINVTRLQGIDAENCLRKASEKFVRRFEQVEDLVEEDGGFAGKTLEELDKYWDKIKKP
ncbi:MAG: tetrapyrrole methylase family protein / MazG family protein [Clostridiales bacterium]|jgi:tetrapyrrole methylase family protein/MazG family protein|nr:tetrapyrrole methylase family protein / MazG family protein [Clostridiales bacterium]MDN5283368.1 tetrapyrrole methylase family protein / MazG family protein [Candidatus Ozemobacter sp.]